MRSPIAAALLAAALLAQPALADSEKKPKPASLRTPCATDENLAQETSLDILSVDFEAGRRTAVAVLRLDTTRATPDPRMLLGAGWTVTITSAGVRHTFTKRRVAGPTERYAYSFEGPKGAAEVSVRETATEIRWNVSRSAVVLKKNAPLECAAHTTVAGLTADTAASRTGKRKR